MCITDQLIENNQRYAAGFTKGELPLAPAKGVAVLACMDSRLLPSRVLGIEEGEAHIVRNAGGLATEDAIRSLAVSQRLGKTSEIIVIHHTDCGIFKVSNEDFRSEIAAEVGEAPTWSTLDYPDLQASVRGTIERIKASPFLPHTEKVRGFIYDVELGLLQEVAR